MPVVSASDLRDKMRDHAPVAGVKGALGRCVMRCFIMNSVYLTCPRVIKGVILC